MNLLSKVVVLSALAGFGATANTAVAEIPEVTLKAVYDSCKATASASPHFSAEQVETYCSCVKVGMKRDITVEQYAEMSIVLRNKQTDAESMKALKKISAACLIETLQ